MGLVITVISHTRLYFAALSWSNVLTLCTSSKLWNSDVETPDHVNQLVLMVVTQRVRKQNSERYHAGNGIGTWYNDRSLGTEL